MKKNLIKASFLLAFSMMTFFISAQENQISESLDPVTGFPEITYKPYCAVNWGASLAFVTRIQKQTERSNFVLKDKMAGAFVELQTGNMKPVNSLLRLSAFYPYSTKFNDVPQAFKQTLTYGVDIFYAPIMETDMWHYIRIKFGPGLHFLYQLTDDWNYIHLGGGALLGIELPLSKGWTVLMDGIATYDYANLGSNRKMMHIDYSWDYQIEIGARYSKKMKNNYSYIDSRKK